MLATIVSVAPFRPRPRPGTGGAFLVLVAFLISFLAIRTSARLTRSVSWWPGGVKSGDVHIHHLVWGICLMMFSGFLAFAMPLEAPWWHIFAIGFGVGVGFTLDEFALWVRLKDVYWSEEGRTSLDAVVVAAAFAALVVLGTNPFDLGHRGGGHRDPRPGRHVFSEGTRAVRRHRGVHPGRRVRWCSPAGASGVAVGALAV